MPNESKLKMPDEILRVALSKEKQAYEFYKRLTTQCRVDSVRRLLESLSIEEGKHIHMIEKMMANLRSGHNAM